MSQRFLNLARSTVVATPIISACYMLASGHNPVHHPPLECFSIGVCRGTSSCPWGTSLMEPRSESGSLKTSILLLIPFHADGGAPSFSLGNTLQWEPERAVVASSTSLSRKCNSLMPVSWLSVTTLFHYSPDLRSPGFITSADVRTCFTLAVEHPGLNQRVVEPRFLPNIKINSNTGWSPRPENTLIEQ